MGINENPLRVGNFNSSEIVALTTMPTAAEIKKGTIFSKGGLTFISECNWERKLGRSITTETNAKALSWGKLLEAFVFNMLGLEYIMTSLETDVHPKYDFWVGSKDGIKHDDGKTLFDIKCPITPKSFCQLVEPLYNQELSMTEVDGVWVFDGYKAINWVRDNHKDGEKYFWQIVSNSIINDCKYGELIVYMPYKSELENVKKLADGRTDLYWLTYAKDEELPYLNDGGFYKDLNIIRFEIPQSDKDFLENRVLNASGLLINR